MQLCFYLASFIRSWTGIFRSSRMVMKHIIIYAVNYAIVLRLEMKLSMEDSRNPVKE